MEFCWVGLVKLCLFGAAIALSASLAQGPASAIYVGDLKLIRVYETGALKLFDIAKDPGERRDLAREMADNAKELDARLTAYLAAVNAQMPKPNPNYDPSKPSETTRDRGGKGRKNNR